MNGDDIDGLYAERIWSWDWLGRPIGVHPAIRPADIDGWLHQSGEMLILEGKVTRANVMTPPCLSTPQLNAVRDMRNLSALLIHADDTHWRDHRPTRLRGYQVLGSAGFGSWWQGGVKYQPLGPSLTDEDTLRTVLNVVVMWCTWADLHGRTS